MFLLYTFLYLTAVSLLFPFEFLKRPEHLRWRWFKEKTGFLNPTPREPKGKVFWIHAVSVGETLTSVPLVRRLKELYPSSHIIVSTVTDTGQNIALNRLGDIASIIYLPFDCPFAAARAVNRIQPSIFIIMETELWPNLIRTLHCKGIPTVLMNGRISEKSFKGYLKIVFFMSKVLSKINFFCMQNDEYARRVIDLGAPKSKVVNTGNIKFDTRPPITPPEWTKRIKSPTILAGSTHENEEELLLAVYMKLKLEFPTLNLIIAPRHPERFDVVASMAADKAGSSCLRRSGIYIDGLDISGSVIILDAMGELSSVYSIASVAVMGGSFIKHGGQNPLEPAFWSKPIVCGPHMENFPFVKEFYEKGGAIEAKDPNEMTDLLRRILTEPEKSMELGRTARELYMKNSGAVVRSIEIIKRLIEE